MKHVLILYLDSQTLRLSDSTLLCEIHWFSVDVILTFGTRHCLSFPATDITRVHPTQDICLLQSWQQTNGTQEQHQQMQRTKPKSYTFRNQNRHQNSTKIY